MNGIRRMGVIWEGCWLVSQQITNEQTSLQCSPQTHDKSFFFMLGAQYDVHAAATVLTISLVIPTQAPLTVSLVVFAFNKPLMWWW